MDVTSYHDLASAIAPTGMVLRGGFDVEPDDQVPARDPKQLPLCQACKEVYDMYRALNDGLNDTPTD